MMPEEKPAVQDPVLILLTRMNEKIEARFERLETGFGEMQGRQARLGGGFEQMDKCISGMEQRMANTEALQRWALGIMITSWLTLMPAILLK